jgi:glycosyltransferase involved in cell wall biosynthesis
MTPDLTYSVITACLNSARTVRRCIDSVLCQTVLPREYLIVDGASVDGTMDIVRETFAARGEASGTIDVKFLGQGAPRGISAAWNMALAHCSSDVVFILNSDDWYEGECAATALGAFRNNPQADIILASARTYKRGATVPCGILRNRPEYLLPALMPFVHVSCFVRRTVYARVGGFDPTLAFAMDYDFLWRCKKAGMNFAIVPDVVTNFEEGGAANSHRRQARIEVYRIALRHGRSRLIPFFALAGRFISGGLEL